MLDTFELFIRITKTQSQLIKAAVNKYIDNYNKYYFYRQSKKLHSEKGILKTTAFLIFGILELKIFYHMEGDYLRYLCMLKVKPALVLHPNDNYALSTEGDFFFFQDYFRTFIEEINSLIGSKEYYIPSDINNWSVIRIDYAFQFSTKNYDKYIYLIKKSAKQNQRRKYKNSLYIINKSTVINFYDKTYKFIQNRKGSSERDEHILRFEIQCKKEYVFKIAERFNISTINIQNLWSLKIAKVIVEEKMLKYLKTGDYCSLAISHERLSNLFSPKKVEKIENFLSYSLHNTTLLENMAYLYEKATNGKVTENQIKRNLLPALDQVGVNPLALPSKWGIEVLFHPIRLISELNC